MQHNIVDFEWRPDLGGLYSEKHQLLAEATHMAESHNGWDRLGRGGMIMLDGHEAMVYFYERSSVLHGSP